MTVRGFREREDLGRGQRRAVTPQRIAMPRGAFAIDGGRERGVALEEVVVCERRDLVGDLVGGRHRISFDPAILPRSYYVLHALVASL